MAALDGHNDVAVALLQHGADVNARNNDRLVEAWLAGICRNLSGDHFK